MSAQRTSSTGAPPAARGRRAAQRARARAVPAAGPPTSLAELSRRPRRHILCTLAPLLIALVWPPLRAAASPPATSCPLAPPISGWPIGGQEPFALHTALGTPGPAGDWAGAVVAFVEAGTPAGDRVARDLTVAAAALRDRRILPVVVVRNRTADLHAWAAALATDVPLLDDKYGKLWAEWTKASGTDRPPSVVAINEYEQIVREVDTTGDGTDLLRVAFEARRACRLPAPTRAGGGSGPRQTGPGAGAPVR